MPMLSNRQQLYLWIAAAVIATAALITIIAWGHQPPTTRRAEYIIGDPEKGSALFYGSKQCGTCHAVNGLGGRVAPDLSETRPANPAMGWLTSVLWNHAPGMWRQMRSKSKSYPQLNSEEMAHILAFLFQSANLDRAGNVATGEQVFKTKQCGTCHSVRASGGNTAPELSGPVAGEGSATWMRAMWNHAQSMVDPVTKSLGTWPQFSGKEMNDLIAYVSVGTPAAGGRLRQAPGNAARGWQTFQVKCIECHTVNGKGGKEGPELGPQTDLPLGTAQFASVLWNHAPAMLNHVKEKGAALPALHGDELVDLQAFVASLRYFEPTGSAFAGERAFSERGCARCHGQEAEGTREGPRLRAGGDAFTTVSFATALWRHGPKMVSHAAEKGLPWPTLAASDIGDLVSFLNTPVTEKGAP
jgi:mono/diheme cytochrome c family protein